MSLLALPDRCVYAVIGSNIAARLAPHAPMRPRAHFSDATCADQGEQAGRTEELSDLGQLGAASDEFRERNGQRLLAFWSGRQIEANQPRSDAPASTSTG